MNKTSLIRTVVTTGQATQDLHGSHEVLVKEPRFRDYKSHSSVSFCFSSALTLTLIYSLSIQSNSVILRRVPVDMIIDYFASFSRFGGTIWGG